MKLITEVPFELREDGEEYKDEETCDGNCENCSTHNEMSPELKVVFDKMFGGEK